MKNKDVFIWPSHFAVIPREYINWFHALQDIDCWSYNWLMGIPVYHSWREVPKVKLEQLTHEIVFKGLYGV